MVKYKGIQKKRNKYFAYKDYKGKRYWTSGFFTPKEAHEEKNRLIKKLDDNVSLLPKGIQKKRDRYYGYKDIYNNRYWTEGHKTVQDAVRARGNLLNELTKYGCQETTRKVLLNESKNQKLAAYHQSDEYKIKNKLNSAIRSSINKYIAENKISFSWKNIFGYTVKDLMKHLELQFKPGMSWNNHGKWHIDHIKPISSFKFSEIDDPEFKQCWALGNLQPLWAKENMSKGNKYSF